MALHIGSNSRFQLSFLSQHRFLSLLLDPMHVTVWWRCSYSISTTECQPLQLCQSHRFGRLLSVPVIMQKETGKPQPLLRGPLSQPGNGPTPTSRNSQQHQESPSLSKLLEKTLTNGSHTTSGGANTTAGNQLLSL